MITAKASLAMVINL